MKRFLFYFFSLYLSFLLAGFSNPVDKQFSCVPRVLIYDTLNEEVVLSLKNEGRSWDELKNISDKIESDGFSMKYGYAIYIFYKNGVLYTMGTSLGNNVELYNYYFHPNGRPKKLMNRDTTNRKIYTYEFDAEGNLTSKKEEQY